MSSTTAPTNVFYLIDDYAGGSGGPGAGGSGQPVCPDFVAPTVAAATQVAYLFASTFQRPVRLVQKNGGTPPYTLVTGALAAVQLTSCPSGVLPA